MNAVYILFSACTAGFVDYASSSAVCYFEESCKALKRPNFKRLLQMVGVSTLLAVFAGCAAVGPNFSKPEAPVTNEWQLMDKELFSAKPTELVTWWEVFEDPILNELIEQAYRNNYNLEIAGLRVLEARAQLGIAVGNRYPQLQQAVGGATYTVGSENAANTAAGDLRFLEYDVGGSVSWELDFWGKFRRGIESADANLLATIAAYDNTLLLLIAQVADTYNVIRTAEEQLRVARDNVRIQQRSVEITDVRYRNGDVDELDVQQAKTQLLSTQATIPRLEVTLQQARNALSTLLGRPTGNMADILGSKPGRIPYAPEEIAMGAPIDLLRRRPDVRQAELAARAQSALIGVAQADLYPSFTLSGFVGLVAADATSTTRTGSVGFEQLFDWRSLAFNGGPSFSWNILNYGRIRNNVRVQDARLQQLLVNYQNTVLKAAQEVEDGMVAFLRNRQQEQILAANVAAAQRSLELSTVRYREGLSSFQRVLDAQASLLLAQQRQVTAQSDVTGSAIGIYRALGGGWQLRTGQDFVSEKTKEVMEKRVNWGDILKARGVQPPPGDERGDWRWPDW